MWKVLQNGYHLYTRLDNSETEEELQQMREELIDRFGPIPPEVEDLFITVRCRKLAVALGFERMLLKDHSLKCYFINRPDSPYFESRTFKQILSFIQTETNKARLKQVGRLFLLTVDKISSMQEVFQWLKQMNEFVHEKIPA